MRPGREHVVWTLEDVIVEGGHFYSAETFTRSLQAGIREHLWGRYNTNTDHLASEGLVCRMLSRYRTLLRLMDEDDTIQGKPFIDPPHDDLSAHQSSSAKLPDDDNFAALLVMGLCPREFVPQLTLNRDGTIDAWDMPPYLSRVRRLARGWVLDILELRPGLWRHCLGHLQTIQNTKARFEEEEQEALQQELEEALQREKEEELQMEQEEALQMEQEDADEENDPDEGNTMDVD